MLNNVDLFNECLNYKVPNIDKVAHDVLIKNVIPIEKKVSNELLLRNAELIELLTKFNNLNKKGDSSQNSKIISLIDECLRYDGMNYCPFSQYLMVHDLNHDIYLENLNKDEKEYIINCYLEDRHQMYINHEYSDIIFQVLSDSYSHKRKTTLGVEKIKIACEKNGIKRFDNDYEKNYYLLPDNGDKEEFKIALEKNHISYKFAKNHQDKMPDAFIKYNDAIVIVEHKKIKTTGGGQDKQITEIIDFIADDIPGVYFVSYLDGILFNELNDPPKTRKIYRSKQDILNNLSNNKYNYFVNEYGFDKLLDYIVKNN